MENEDLVFEKIGHENYYNILGALLGDGRLKKKKQKVETFRTAKYRKSPLPVLIYVRRPFYK